MGKTYLGRSIIELGRGKHGKYERRQRAKGARRWTLDGEGEYEPGPLKGEGRELRDNLNPLERWLKAHVGKSWDKTYSEFCGQVDRRSIMGDHILGHLRDLVKGAGGREFLFYYDPRFHPPCYADHGFWGLWVDDRGILRHHTRRDCELAGKKAGWDPKEWKLAGVPLESIGEGWVKQARETGKTSVYVLRSRILANMDKRDKDHPGWWLSSIRAAEVVGG